jgi:hypothetical protein
MTPILALKTFTGAGEADRIAVETKNGELEFKPESQPSANPA